MNVDRSPSGLLRAFYRFPILIYRARLGVLLGGRFLMLTHVGRSSGLLRYVVLEVVKQEARQWHVAAAYGDHADWLRNVRVHPQVTVDHRGHRTPAVARELPIAEGAEILSEYALRHPRAAGQLGRLMGVPIDRDPDAAAAKIPIVRLVVEDRS